MNPEIQNLQRQIDEINRTMELMKSSTTIPIEYSTAMKARLASVGGQPSSKTAASETVGGMDSAAGPMDGFVKLEVNGTFRNVPFYD